MTFDLYLLHSRAPGGLVFMPPFRRHCSDHVCHSSFLSPNPLAKPWVMLSLYNLLSLGMPVFSCPSQSILPCFHHVAAGCQPQVPINLLNHTQTCDSGCSCPTSGTGLISSLPGTVSQAFSLIFGLLLWLSACMESSLYLVPF